MFKWALGIGLFSLTLFAAPEKTILLYDVKKMDGVAFEGELKPHRIYIKWEEGRDTWVYVHTTSEKLLVHPTEALQPGTVVPASSFGEKGKGNFKLSNEGKWEKSNDAIQYRIWSSEHPDEIRTLKETPYSSFKLAKGKWK